VPYSPLGRGLLTGSLSTSRDLADDDFRRTLPRWQAEHLQANLVLVERKLLGRIQVRYGPNRAGKYGLLQPFADTIKMMTKEDIVPDAADRVIFLPYMTHGAYLRLNRLCDVMLDTVHWSGGNTSLDALAGGLPVVTLPGGLMRGRQSMGMLRMLGAQDLVAADAEEYVSRAVEMGRDRERRDAASAVISGNLERLFDREEPVAAFNDFLERAAREPGPRS